MEYPAQHQSIVKELLDGKFILAQNNPLYEIIKSNLEFYKDFFKSSFGYDVLQKKTYFFLTSDESNEKLSRDITIFIGILSYELDNEGKNFQEMIRFSIFDYEQIDVMVRGSVYFNVLESIDFGDTRRFLARLARINLIEELEGDKFRFTEAIDLFFDFALTVVEQKKEKLAAKK
jgi:hypothetical protein